MNLRNRQINELCDLRMGHTFRQKPKYRSNGNKLVIQPGDVTAEGTLVYDDLRRAVVSIDQNVAKGDVLLINRGRFTATTFGESPDIECVVSSAFIILTPKNPQLVLSEYLALLFNSIKMQNTFKRRTETTTIPYISCSNLGTLKISIPDPDQQVALIRIDAETKAYIKLTTRKIELRNKILNRLIMDSLN